MVKTITLTAGTPQAVTFSEAYPFYWIDNKTSGEVFASVGGTPEPDTDGTYTIAAGSQLRISGGDFNGGIVLLGEGKVQVVASGIAACPFKSAPVSGGGEIVNNESSYTLTNAADYPIIGLNMYGKSTQDGTPTPENPVDIVSVGDSGTVNIISNNGGEIAVTAAITSALPLCGIPVESGGNYTDSTGQQWVCDELIYNADGTGKIVKRVKKLVFDGSDDETWDTPVLTSDFENDFRIGGILLEDSLARKEQASNLKCYTNLFPNKNVFYNDLFGCYIGWNGGFIVRFPHGLINGTDNATWRNFLSSNPLTLIYLLAEPQEITLTAAEMSALMQLQTFDGTTNISNSAVAEMSVKYCTNKALSEFAYPITMGLQKQIDELRVAILSMGGNV